ncbi:Basic helix-loop-helix DNA-binding superfamily protein [Hibiscus syriacus]|uniref:Basic helix-loop-helix DNA-binding superfamily protein n=1 Tax=Hibiscus syriacus TaxID=106335 RepID=A0A6A2WGR3_HIBSY|nr:Basic helix-loop-helix DNA-binding superfamily protein [Hibiscus syriacus]
MKVGILEVLVVNAEDIRHTNLLGKHKKVLLNEKFKFNFPQSEWEKLTYVKFKIMDKEFFEDNGFVGETK